MRGGCRTCDSIPDLKFGGDRIFGGLGLALGKAAAEVVERELEEGVAGGLCPNDREEDLGTARKQSIKDCRATNHIDARRTGE